MGLAAETGEDSDCPTNRMAAATEWFDGRAKQSQTGVNGADSARRSKGGHKRIKNICRLFSVD
jgi:hypothetical protein